MRPRPGFLSVAGRGREVFAVLQNGVDGVQERLGMFGFGHEAVRTDFLCLLQHLARPVHGENQNLDLGEKFSDHSRRFETVHIGHGDVEGHQIGLQFLGHADGLGPILGLAAHFKIRSRL